MYCGHKQRPIEIVTNELRDTFRSTLRVFMCAIFAACFFPPHSPVFAVGKNEAREKTCTRHAGVGELGR